MTEDQAVPGSAGSLEPGAEATAEPADEAVTVTRGPRPSVLLVLVSLILALVVAMVVMTWLSLGVVTQLRDQTTTANGLQHCLIQAQLSAANASDNGAAYRSAVQACLNK